MQNIEPYLRHLLDVHEEEEEQWEDLRFGMRILKNTRTAFERQILESVLIQKARHNIMNNKAEYNHWALPRLTTKVGERDRDKWREEDRREMEKEATIEEKIRIRKKEKAKKRGTANRRMEHGQPMQKKRRLEAGLEAENQGQEDKVDKPKTIVELPKKRKVLKEDKKPSKKARKNMEIKRYIT
jgi:hypothetical protein